MDFALLLSIYTTTVCHNMWGNVLFQSLSSLKMSWWFGSFPFALSKLEEIRPATCTFHHWASSLLTNSAALLSLLAREQHISLEKCKRLGAKCPTEAEWGLGRRGSSQQEDFTCLTGASHSSSSCFVVLDWADTTREQRQPHQSASRDKQWMCNYDRWSEVCRLKR